MGMDVDTERVLVHFRSWNTLVTVRITIAVRHSYKLLDRHAKAIEG